MDFPDKIDGQKMSQLITESKGYRIHPIYTDGEVVVADLGRATIVAFFDRGSVVARYRLLGDETWRLVTAV